ncbi:replicative DNA helicase [Pelistega ratti]|uniref:replicative DNA helicase n=1 Tax=Pelistega ratti TaxID=2652177 RepID=UPI0013594224|nr:replicative DNA helicase [Pelistega ratti]
MSDKVAELDFTSDIPPENPNFTNLRLPPQSIEAEQSVLGALLIENSAFNEISSLLSEEDFYRHDHRLIWRHIYQLISLDREADVITVAESLRLVNKEEEVGGLAYLNDLAMNVASAANITRYAEIVRERSMLRQLVAVADEIATMAFQPNGRQARQLLDEAEAKVFKISQDNGAGAKDFHTMPNVMVQVIEELEKLAARDNDSLVTGISTGFTDLDARTAGMHSGQLIIVAGRPAMGKTSFAMNIVEHVAIHEKLPVAVFSMEMDAVQLGHRLLGSVGKIDQQRMRTGRLRDEDWPGIIHATSLLQDAKIFIDETPALTPIDLRARARRLKSKEGELGLIVVDYLQLMSGNGRNDNRTAEISEISRSLKQLARDLKCPIIALSQLNRGLEQRTNKRPIMSDLRESGAIEQDADVILFIYRDEVYNPESPDKGTAEIIIGKQRAGSIGTVRLTFAGEYTKFFNYTGAGAAFVGE